MLGVHTPIDLRTAPARRSASIAMFSTTPRPESTRYASDCDVITGVLVPIRIRPHDKSKQRAQVRETKGVVAVLPDESIASYTGWIAKFCILCGSV
jgi:hypothetical protein